MSSGIFADALPIAITIGVLSGELKCSSPVAQVLWDLCTSTQERLDGTSDDSINAIDTEALSAAISARWQYFAKLLGSENATALLASLQEQIRHGQHKLDAWGLALLPSPGSRNVPPQPLADHLPMHAQHEPQPAATPWQLQRVSAPQQHPAQHPQLDPGQLSGPSLECSITLVESPTHRADSSPHAPPTSPPSARALPDRLTLTPEEIEALAAGGSSLQQSILMSDALMLRSEASERTWSHRPPGGVSFMLEQESSGGSGLLDSELRRILAGVSCVRQPPGRPAQQLLRTRMGVGAFNGEDSANLCDSGNGGGDGSGDTNGGGSGGGGSAGSSGGGPPAPVPIPPASLRFLADRPGRLGPLPMSPARVAPIAEVDESLAASSGDNSPALRTLSDWTCGAGAEPRPASMSRLRPEHVPPPLDLIEALQAAALEAAAREAADAAEGGEAAEATEMKLIDPELSPFTFALAAASEEQQHGRQESPRFTFQQQQQERLQQQYQQQQQQQQEEAQRPETFTAFGGVDAASATTSAAAAAAATSAAAAASTNRAMRRFDTRGRVESLLRAHGAPPHPASHMATAAPAPAAITVSAPLSAIQLSPASRCDLGQGVAACGDSRAPLQGVAEGGGSPLHTQTGYSREGLHGGGEEGGEARQGPTGSASASVGVSQGSQQQGWAASGAAEGTGGRVPEFGAAGVEWRWHKVRLRLVMPPYVQDPATPDSAVTPSPAAASASAAGAASPSSAAAQGTAGCTTGEGASVVQRQRWRHEPLLQLVAYDVDELVRGAEAVEAALAELRERHQRLETLLAHEHKLLEAVFPRQAIEHMTRVIAAQSQPRGRPGAATTAAAAAATAAAAAQQLYPVTAAMTRGAGSMTRYAAAAAATTPAPAPNGTQLPEGVISMPLAGAAGSATLLDSEVLSEAPVAAASEGEVGLVGGLSGVAAAPAATAAAAPQLLSFGASEHSGGLQPCQPAAPMSGAALAAVPMATAHRHVTVLFCDIVGFTAMSNCLQPMQVMAFLNGLFTRFDSLCDVYGVYKVETIGDCFMAVGGLIALDCEGFRAVRGDGSEDRLHALKVMSFAKALLREAAQHRMPHDGAPLRVRVGLHSGPVTSGIVGSKMPRFCLFGDTVNTASRMESTCEPGCVHASAETAGLLPGERWDPTGGVMVKGKGEMKTFVWRPPSDNTPLTAGFSSHDLLGLSVAARTAWGFTASGPGFGSSPAAAMWCSGGGAGGAATGGGGGGGNRTAFSDGEAVRAELAKMRLEMRVTGGRVLPASFVGEGGVGGGVGGVGGLAERNQAR